MGPDELSPVDAVALRRFLDGDQAIVREHVRAVIARPEFRKGEASPPTEQYREQVMEWARILARTGGPALLYPREFGGLGQVGAAITAFETLGHTDLSLLVKCGVQFGLFGGAVQHLGNEEHRRTYLPDIMKAKLTGCFAFDHVRVPRGNLLDRYAKVDENGDYSSPIENPNKRFFTTIGTLVQG